jgi:hypothetical protein
MNGTRFVREEANGHKAVIQRLFGTVVAALCEEVECLAAASSAGERKPTADLGSVCRKKIFHKFARLNATLRQRKQSLRQTAA